MGIPREEKVEGRVYTRGLVRQAKWKEAHVLALMNCRKNGISIPELLKWIRDDDPDAFPLSVEHET